jgi:hypothetical protein
MAEHLLLKWGTLKGWDLESDASMGALRKYADGGISPSAMAQRDTEAQKQALCELIDAVDGEIVNDWTGETMTKDEAKKYVMEWDRS